MSVQMVRASSRKAVAVRRRVRASTTEIVVTATQVLHERETADDHPGGVVAFESAHRPEPRLEPAVVCLQLLVLLGVVKRGRHQLLDHHAERGRAVGHASTGSP